MCLERENAVINFRKELKVTTIRDSEQASGGKNLITMGLEIKNVLKKI